jgi:NAD(P)-dependent dehydrogenase (short-subunit alcohol dehydrogenase family)
MHSMKGKSLLVVGGSSGIGLSVTREIRAAGGEVYVASRSGAESGDVDGVRHIPFDAGEPGDALDSLPEQLDGLVYSPGTIRLKPFDQLKESDFAADLELNFLGAVRVVKLCLPRLRAAPDGASVVFFSTVAVQLGMPFHASIAAAKGAVEGFTRSLAAELAPAVRVNAVAPSLTDTPLATRLLNTDGKRKAAADRHPMKRVGLPEDVADCVVFLLSSRSSWMTGQVLHVDGGLSAVRLFAS